MSEIDHHGRGRSNSVLSERRRSLPSVKSFSTISDTASIAGSIAASVSLTVPDAQDFQTRRRRAAKLASFFGVNHKELVKTMLDDLESGVKQERTEGRLGTQEAEVSLPLLKR